MIFIGPGSRYGSINITSEAWNSLTHLEIRHVGKVSIEGQAVNNARNSITIASVNELRASKATHWGKTTIFDNIQNVYVDHIKAESARKAIVSAWIAV